MFKGCFFEHVGSDVKDLDRVADAWMKTAILLYSGADYEDLVRATGWDGQDWRIDNCKITKGFKV